MFSHTTACRTDNQYWSYTSLFVPSIWRFPNFHVLLSSDEMSAAGSTHLKRLSIQRSESHSALPLNYERYVSMVRQLGHPPQPHSTNAPCPAGSWPPSASAKMPFPHPIPWPRPTLRQVQAFSSHFHLHSEKQQQCQLIGRTAAISNVSTPLSENERQ